MTNLHFIPEESETQSQFEEFEIMEAGMSRAEKKQPFAAMDGADLGVQEQRMTHI